VKDRVGAEMLAVFRNLAIGLYEPERLGGKTQANESILKESARWPQILFAFFWSYGFLYLTQSDQIQLGSPC